MDEVERYDVAIVGGGPAGLSAAIVLGRCRRRVLIIDDEKPRNRVARSVNGFLGLEAIDPWTLRKRGREQAEKYGVGFIEGQVDHVNRLDDARGGFEVVIGGQRPVLARKVLLATGVRDKLPEVEGIETFYGTSVHHCPYCDGWEHQSRRLVALGDAESAVNLALSLLTWSPHVVACTNGESLDQGDRNKLEDAGAEFCTGTVIRVEGSNGQLERLILHDGATIECDALFFSDEQYPRTEIPRRLGCDINPEGHTEVHGKQKASETGIFLAGDVCGNVQFAIVAAAEGAKAATAINQEIQTEDLKRAILAERSG